MWDIQKSCWNASVICKPGPYGDYENIAGCKYHTDLIIVPAVPRNCEAIDSMPKLAGVISHLPASSICKT